MVKDQDNQEDYTRLVNRIKEVFADVPYPGDDNIISTPEHVKICGECTGLRNALAGRRWTELAEEEPPRGELFHAMNFFSAAGLQYYLPAYLIQSVKNRWFRSTYFRPPRNPEYAADNEERTSRLTPDQCKVVIAFLLITLKEAVFYEPEGNIEAVRHWKGLYQRALANNQGAG